jgi:hypothetical protein
MRSQWKEDNDIEEAKMFILQQKLKHIRDRLKQWNKEYFGSIFQEK